MHGRYLSDGAVEANEAALQPLRALEGGVVVTSLHALGRRAAGGRAGAAAGRGGAGALSLRP